MLIINNAKLPELKKRGPKKQIRILDVNNPARKLAREAGEVFYDRKVPCNNGHNSLRYVKNNHCVECEKQAKLKHRKITRNEWATNLKRNYGITKADYNHFLKIQNNQCAICKVEFINIKICVDHCHDTKKVRGLLCHNCNVGIGNLRHNSEFLRKAALYCEET